MWYRKRLKACENTRRVNHVDKNVSVSGFHAVFPAHVKHGPCNRYHRNQSDPHVPTMSPRIPFAFAFTTAIKLEILKHSVL